MDDKLRKKCHLIEMSLGHLDNLESDETVREMVGYYYPADMVGKKWEVTLEWEGEGYTANSQFEAEVLAHIATQNWLVLKKIRGGKG